MATLRRATHTPRADTQQHPIKHTHAKKNVICIVYSSVVNGKHT